jgi:hypothetical protein
MLGKIPGEPGFDDYGEAIQSQAKLAMSGNLGAASELLASQALTLDAMFTELARRATMNLGDYPEAAERYARLAFKAQSNSRAALEALAKLHQPREQTVKHVHVNDGAQAVVAEHFHQHTGGTKNTETAEQSHAAQPPGSSASLLGPDPSRAGMPVPSSERQTEMQDARRD